MAVIEFKKESDKLTVMAMIQPTKEQLKLKRGLYLLKNGLWSPDW